MHITLTKRYIFCIYIILMYIDIFFSQYTLRIRRLHDMARRQDDRWIQASTAAVDRRHNKNIRWRGALRDCHVQRVNARIFKLRRTTDVNSERRLLLLFFFSIKSSPSQAFNLHCSVENFFLMYISSSLEERASRRTGACYSVPLSSYYYTCYTKMLL